jgi:ribulose-phosphate 3-epimerase
VAEVVPAILVKSKEEFDKRLRLVEPLVDRIQWDIMDGVFVENITFSDVSALEDLETKLAIEADLMVAEPQDWIERFAALRPRFNEGSQGSKDSIGSSVDQLIFHIESTAEPEVLIQDARSAGFKIGLTLDPTTPLKQVWDYLDEIDRFQVMGGRSGFGGQDFDPSVLETIREVRKSFPSLPISVDIGVNAETAPEMISAGANILCAGSFIFNSDNIEEAIKQLKEADNA